MGRWDRLTGADAADALAADGEQRHEGRQPSGPVVIRCVGVMGVSAFYPPVPGGAYLASYDPDGRAGLGSITWTDDIAQAMIFPGHAEAWACWRQTSTVLPRRADGKPNRPLTAYSVSLAPAGGQR